MSGNIASASISLLTHVSEDWNGDLQKSWRNRSYCLDLGFAKLFCKVVFFIQLIRERLSEKNTTRRDKSERWSGYSLELCILAQYKSVFLHVKILFFLSGGLFLQLFLMSYVWGLKILLKFSVAKSTLFPHVSRKETCNKFAFVTSPSH